MAGEGGYLAAILIYVGSALIALLAMAWWLRHSWRPVWIWLLVLVGAALLLTPAYPHEGIATLAPALVVAAFQLLTAGPDAAQHAFRPLAVALGLAVLITLFLRFVLLRNRREISAKGS